METLKYLDKTDLIRRWNLAGGGLMKPIRNSFSENSPEGFALTVLSSPALSLPFLGGGGIAVQRFRLSCRERAEYPSQAEEVREGLYRVLEVLFAMFPEQSGENPVRRGELLVRPHQTGESGNGIIACECDFSLYYLLKPSKWDGRIPLVRVGELLIPLSGLVSLSSDRVGEGKEMWYLDEPFPFLRTRGSTETLRFSMLRLNGDEGQNLLLRCADRGENRCPLSLPVAFPEGEAGNDGKAIFRCRSVSVSVDSVTTERGEVCLNGRLTQTGEDYRLSLPVPADAE